jgi:uncharacterized protein DUF6283
METDPRTIPNGYCETKHRQLRSTIAAGSPGEQLKSSALHAMACHNSPIGNEEACVGWLHHQLGVGNNVMLRLKVLAGTINANYALDGEQHQSLEDTFPK